MGRACGIRKGRLEILIVFLLEGINRSGASLDLDSVERRAKTRGTGKRIRVICRQAINRFVDGRDLLARSVLRRGTIVCEFPLG